MQKGHYSSESDESDKLAGAAAESDSEIEGENWFNFRVEKAVAVTNEESNEYRCREGRGQHLDIDPPSDD